MLLEFSFPETVILNYHYSTQLPPFLLVEDLSPGAQWKWRLEAGTPLTSCP